MASGADSRRVPTPPADRAVLDPAHGALEVPIRAEIFGTRRFEQHGHSLGQAQRSGPAARGGSGFVPRLRANIQMLRLAHRAIAGDGDHTTEDPSPAAEWLLDNFHLIEAQLEQVRTQLPRRYFRSLPVLLDAPLAGLPQIYGVAWAFVAHTDSAFDDDMLVSFLRAYQGATELRLGEMWALPTTLRVLLIENLRRLAERVACHQAARALANRCCDDLEAFPVATLQAMLPPLAARGVTMAFLGQLAQRLHLQDVPTGATDTPHRRWLRTLLPDVAVLQNQLRAEQAANNLSVSNALRSLRDIDDADWPDIVARSSALMQLLMGWPLFAAEHPATRDTTLHAIEALARRRGRSETAVAEALLARVVPAAGAAPEAGWAATLPTTGGTPHLAAFWLEGAGRDQLCADLGLPRRPAWRDPLRWRQVLPQVALPAYLGAIAVGTLVLPWLLLRGSLADAGGPAAVGLGITALLLALPASEAVIALVNRIVSEAATPRLLPRMALAAGLGAEQRVLVVIPALLTDTITIDDLVHRLHLHHLANRDPETQFALLGDWRDAPAAEQPDDDALLQHALACVRALNREHPVPGPAPRFLLLQRARRFSAGECCWLGWERKRGKLEQLMRRLVEGDDGSFFALGAESTVAADTRYVLTLDSDTQLPPGALRALLAVAAHPANQPVLALDACRVASGFGVLQPRTVLPLPTEARRTPYHWLFAGQPGSDPYSAASSEVYQDLFGEGSFTGKGLLHVASAHAVLGARLPEGQVLSHDLLEGALLRCAAVSDVAVIEDAPAHAGVAAARAHRWTRGDWQLLPFVVSRRWPLGALNRWKMLDNLRRSLVAPASVLLLLLAASGVLPRPGAVVLLVLAALAAGPLLGAIVAFAPSRDAIAKRYFYRLAWLDLLRAVLAGGWLLLQLLPQALRQLDAIARALYRQGISRQHLLEWTTADRSAAQHASAPAAPTGAQWRSSVLALVLAGLGLLWLDRGSPGIAVLWLSLCGLWALAPWLDRWASRPPRAGRDRALPTADVETLHGIARDTWRTFERSVGPDDLHLPPDNLQVDPQEILARRTSPTNMGMYLLSAACAREFGWIGTVEWIERMDATLTTMEGLPRYRGHFFNWYDTATGAPLLPMYVSTVDSGNLCGHLLTVAQACRARAAAPLDRTASMQARQRARRRLAPLLALPEPLDEHARDELRWLLADQRAARHSAARDAGTRVLEPLAAGTRPVSSSEAAAARAARCSADLQALAERCEALAWLPEFAFLYDERRHLLHIGFRVAEQTLDAGRYDLLASESRLTSLVAIAKGELPVQHWATLGRPFRAVGALAGLRSWSGSMFEYLMPTLVLDEPCGSVLHEAGVAAVREQRHFAELRHVPWGISESAHAERDHGLTYQYAPQGVPTLALRRTPADELVVAPYATALAAMLEPLAALRNWAALTRLHARGRFGFIEALDFTLARQPAVPAAPPAGVDGARRGFVPVRTFMAHHQGMSIVALANVLLGGVAQRWGMSHPHIEAVASLLHERAPRELPLVHTVRDAAAPRAQRRRGPGRQRELLPGANAVEPTQVLANGRYGVTLRANGAGHSQWRGIGVHRWRDDALRDASGSFVYLRPAGGSIVSLTQHPAPDPAADYGSSFHADRVVLEGLWPHLHTRLTVWVSPEDDIEFRQVELHNLGGDTLDLELISAFEPTLSDPRADEAHPAFANLFLQADWLHDARGLRFVRQPRRDDEPGACLVHFIAQIDATVLGLTQQTERAAWQGRGHGPSQPQGRMEAAPRRPDAVDATEPADASTALGTGLDPVCALGARLRIGPGGKARVTFATAVGHHVAGLDSVLDTYALDHAVQRASLMSATLADIRLRSLRVSPHTLAAAQSLCTALLFTLARRTEAGEAGGAGEVSVHDRRVLWRFGLSGERAIVLVTIGSIEGLGLMRALAQALRLWSWGGVGCDLVCIDDEPMSYPMALQRELQSLRERHGQESAAEQASHGTPAAPGCTALHVLRGETLAAEERRTLRALARVRLLADGRTLHQQVTVWNDEHQAAREQRQQTHGTPLLPSPGRVAAPPRTPAGRFEPGSGAYGFAVHAGQRPPRPWINVLANAQAGCHVSESGAGCTWAGNSRLNQLSAWSNDAVGDPAAEWFVLQDLTTREVWNPLPGPAWAASSAAMAYRLRTAGAPPTVWQVRHEPGRTQISHRRGALEVALSWCVDADSAVKQVQVHLHNRGPGVMRLRLSAIVEWMMGAQRADRASVQTAWQPGRRGAPAAVLCTQGEAGGGFGGGTAFLTLSSPQAGADPVDWTCDRRECFDARGAPLLPDHWGQRAGAGLDPVAALSLPVTLAPGEATTAVLLLGWAATPAVARALLAAAGAVPAAQREQSALAAWDTLLGATVVRTPDPLFDALVNRWLLYQTVACRMWAKAGFYQAGGATGFRDQLQDSLALAWAAPAMLRQQILHAASRQFPEGDVQHWWHSPGGAGVRTRFSDDLLWLPLATLHHLRCTGDAALLDEAVPFIEGPALAEGAEDLYSTPEISSEQASVYEHAARAIDRSLRVGAHGLPLMGGGDWNDGMNRVGIGGRGESVWLAWFLCTVVAGFAPLAESRGDAQRAARWRSAAVGWRQALDGPAWDGAWFRRAFFDDGQVLGSASRSEARIDLIAQVWAVLSGATTPARQGLALAAVETELLDQEHGLIRLLVPPLRAQEPDAGYIQAYPPGVRENGGQYSHAAVWLLFARAKRAWQQAADGDAQAVDTAAAQIWREFGWLSPAHRSAHATQGPLYGLEPYAMAGDVCAAAPYAGRGGWSWYTGAAAWMHRAAIEAMFGLDLQADTLCFRPCLPRAWSRAEMLLRREGKVLRFVLRRGAAAEVEATVRDLDARLLAVGEALDWRAVASGSVYVLALPAPGSGGVPTEAGDVPTAA